MFEQPSENQPATNPEPHFEPPITPTPPPNPVRKKRSPLVFILLLLIVVALAAVATYAVMTFAIGSSKKTDDITPKAATTTSTTQTQGDKILAAIDHVKTLLPSTKAFAAGEVTYSPHRKVGTPYDIYASGTTNDAWHVRSDVIVDTASAGQVTKTIYQYFVTDQKATIDTLIGDTAFGPVEKTDTKYVSYRVNTADYTCGLSESPSNSTTKGTVIGLSCSTTDEYTKNAKNQQPFYAAMSTDKTYTADVTMLGAPKITTSATSGYKTAEVGIGGDSELAGGAMGLFYQTPDGVWHFFKGTQQILTCTAYTTTDLKKAYVGQACFDSTKNVNSTVTIN